jgi:hypothetical protein
MKYDQEVYEALAENERTRLKEMNANQIVDLENKVIELADELQNNMDLWFKDEVAGDWVIKTLRKQSKEIEHWKNAFERAMDLTK